MKRFKALQVCLAFITLILSGILITGCGSNDDTNQQSPAKKLISVEVTSAKVSIPIGVHQQFIAAATYDDGTSTDVTASSSWTSGATGVATVNGTSGLATGVTEGTAVITADFDGKSGSETLTVTAATLSSIKVTPATAAVAIGVKQTFVATGTYSDGTSHDISNSVTWSSGATGVATVVSITGVATGLSAGAATITANLDGESGSATLTVLPASVKLTSVKVTPLTASVPMGVTQRFVATAFYSNGYSFDVSNNSKLIWSSSATGVATIVSPGIATGRSIGTTTITATLICDLCEPGPSIFGTATLTVTAATLMSIAVTPETASVAIGVKQSFVATGTYSDGTSHDISNIVAWSPDPTGIATVVSTTGVATGVATGTTHIIATLGALSDFGILTVTITTPPGSCLVGALPLGSAASFAVLGGPALTITNPTSVTGDVGAMSITPPTGPSTLISGTLYDATGTGPGVITAAVTDMQTAISCALNRPCEHNYTVATDFSAVAAANPLAPGVYCVGAAMNVSSPVILTLSTPGVYIFRSTGALTSASGVTVQLGGTANANNTSIFWVSSGAASEVSIGANNHFLGTILVSPGAATLGADTTLLGGRVLASSAATLGRNTITIPVP